MSFDPSSAFDAYLVQLGACDVMSADAERLSAERIAQRRRERWAAIFSVPAAVPTLLAIATEVLPGCVDAKLARQACTAAAAIGRRGAEASRSRARYDRAIDAVARELCASDRDHVVADTLTADLETLATGQPTSARLTAATKHLDRETVRHWAEQVRRASAAFWHARGAFARANLRLVVSMARRVGRGRMALSDLVQEGNIGLLQAIDRFDVERGFRFSTYGAWWIRHAMNRALQNKSREIRLPVHILDAIGRVQRARRDWERKHGTAIPIATLAEVTGFAEPKLEKLARYELLSDVPASLDAPTSEDGFSTRLEAIVDETQLDAGDAITREMVHEAIEHTMAELPRVEQEILRLRFGLDDDEGQTLREIGEQYSLSRERIRQLQERALGRIRAELDRRQLA